MLFIIILYVPKESMEGLVARVVDHPIREQFKRTRKWKRRSSTHQNASASALRRCHLKTGKKIGIC